MPAQVQARPADDAARAKGAGQPRPIESSTRVTVAFPFSTIKVSDLDDAHTDAIEELASLVAALTQEIDSRFGTKGTAELRARSVKLAERLAPD